MTFMWNHRRARGFKHNSDSVSPDFHAFTIFYPASGHFPAGNVSRKLLHLRNLGDLAGQSYKKITQTLYNPCKFELCLVESRHRAHQCSLGSGLSPSSQLKDAILVFTCYRKVMFFQVCLSVCCLWCSWIGPRPAQSPSFYSCSSLPSTH